MKRFALLIAAPKLKDHRPLPGTEVDVVKLREWLLSDRGGAWEPNEIKTFSNPAFTDLKPYLTYQSGCDYAFTAFAGHGYMVKAEYGGHDTVVCLRDGEDLRVKELNPGNKRCTVVADCCRNLITDIPAELIKEALTYNAKSFSAYDDRARLRALFDQAVTAAEEGATYLYSCDKNQQAADDDDDGGLFTFHLLKAAREWAGAQARPAVLRLDTAFATAKARVTVAEPQQHPEMPPVRRLVHFPFAVA